MNSRKNNQQLIDEQADNDETVTMGNVRVNRNFLTYMFYHAGIPFNRGNEIQKNILPAEDKSNLSRC